MDTQLHSVRALHRVAVHVLARARRQAAGRTTLRVTPGGFGTPDLDVHGRRVRVARGTLVVETDRRDGSIVRAIPILGSSLRELAAVAEVDLTEPLEVGRDTPALGDVDAPITLDPGVALAVCQLFGLVAGALDGVVAQLPERATPTMARLWPEHFDLALNAEGHSGVRVNLGGSPGDEYCREPYLYVGPFTADRPGDASFWNAPFGALRPVSALTGDVQQAAVEFLLEGYSLM